MAKRKTNSKNNKIWGSNFQDWHIILLKMSGFKKKLGKLRRVKCDPCRGLIKFVNRNNPWEDTDIGLTIQRR